MKICNGCRRIFPPAEMAPRRGRCIACAKAYDRERSRLRRAAKGTTKMRGYGKRHEQLRKSIARQVAAGLATCSRCRQPIAPGTPWDLDHDDEDRGKYLGPSHRACNRGARSNVFVASEERARFSRRW
jgi:hypothetical protein